MIGESGRLVFGKLRERKNVLTGERDWKATVQPLPLPEPTLSAPDHVFVPGRGDKVYAIWSAGQLVRYDVRNPAEPAIAETIESVSAAVGRRGDGGGSGDWTRDAVGGRQRRADCVRGLWSVTAMHKLPTAVGCCRYMTCHPDSSAVRDLGISQRSRMVAVGYDDGSARVVQVTTESDVATAHVSDGRVGGSESCWHRKTTDCSRWSDGELWGADFDPAYPETTFQSLFRPVWYEGYEQPDYVWQSSFAGVQSEMKLGLMPLIFGTLKATVYSMLFGVPIALLAAIYTSEFLKPSYRNRVKSLIETMASLPSVVLGFLGWSGHRAGHRASVPTTICSL